MATQVGELYQKLTIKDDEFNQTLGKAKSNTGGLSKMLKVGLAGAAITAGAALAGMAMQGFKNIRELRDATRRYKSEVGATEEEAEHFSDTIQKLHKNNTDSYEELGDTVTALRQKFGEASKGMEQDVLDYAKVTKQEGVGAVKSLNSVMKAWDKDASELSSTMDKLYAVQQKTGMEAGAMQKGLAEAAPSMKALNMSMDEGIAMMGQFAARGVDANSASRVFRNLMARTADPTKMQAEAMETLGVKVAETSDGFNVASDAVDVILKKLSEGKLTAEEKAAALDILGRRAGEDLVRAYQKGEKGVKDMMKVIENSKKSVKEASEEYDLQLGERWTLIKRRYLHPFMETIGTGLMNVLESALIFIEKWAPRVEQGFQVFSETITDVDKLKEALTGVKDYLNNLIPEGPVGDALRGIAIGLAAIGGALAIKVAGVAVWTALSSLGSAIAGLAGATLTGLISTIASPIGIITAVLAGGYAIWQSFFSDLNPIISDFASTLAGEGIGAIKDTIKALMSGDFEEIPGIWEDAFTKIKDKALELWPSIKAGLEEGWEDLKTYVKEKSSELWESFEVKFPDIAEAIDLEGLKESFSGLLGELGPIVNKIRGVIQDFINIFTGAEKKPKEGASDLKKGLIKILAGISETIQAKLDTIKGAFKIGEAVFSGDWDTALEEIKNVFNSWKDAFKPLVSGFMSTVKGILKITGLKDIWDKALEKIKTAFNDKKEQITSKATEIIDGIKTSFSNKKQAVIDKATAIAEGILGPFSDIKQKVVGKITSLVSGITETFTNKKQSITDKVTGIANEIKNNIIPDLKEKGKKLIQTLTAGIDLKKDSPIQIAEKLSQNLDKVFSEINLTETGKNILKGLKSGFETVKETVLKPLNGLAGLIKEKTGVDLKEIGKGVLNTFKGGLDSASDESLLSSLTSIGQDIKDKLTIDLIPKGKAIIASLTEGINLKTDSPLQVLKQLATNIKGELSGIDLTETGKAILKSVKEGFKTITSGNFLAPLKGIKESIETKLDIDLTETGKAILRTLKKGFENFIEVLLTPLAGLKGSIEKKLNIDLEQTGKDILNTLKKGFKAYLGILLTPIVSIKNKLENKLDIDLEQVGKDILGSLKTGFENKTEQIKNSIIGIKNTIVEEAKKIPGKMVGIGESIVSGIISGIKNMGGGLKQAWSNFLKDKLPKWAQNLLGISSPSKVMMGIGEDVVRGLAVGIENAQQEALQAIENVSTDVMRGVQAPRATTAGTAQTINQPIEIMPNLTKLTLDSTERVDELNRKIQRSFEQRQRGRGYK